jgi:hypothetical protein
MRQFPRLPRHGRFLAIAASTALALALLDGAPPATAATQIDITGPAGSDSFGASVTLLTNGNFVVADPGYDAPGPVSNVGAVYLYDGATGALISTLTGATDGDRVGSGGVTALTNGNFVVASPLWDDPAPVANVGAVTWVDGTTGLAGSVDSSNSLVGSSSGDTVGDGGVTALTNGNYVVASPSWGIAGPILAVGAATWGDGSAGITGAVNDTNSLVGSTVGDNVSSRGVTALTNGNYVVASPFWSAPGPVLAVGAATWGDGSTGISGPVSDTNSLVGPNSGDDVSNGGVTALTNGNYVVASITWTGLVGIEAGAATWGNGTTGTAGFVSAINSLVGSTLSDRVGNGGVTPLTNGNYVVVSPDWDAPGPVADVGAATWGDGSTGTTGAVNDTNSLVGATADDSVGSQGVTALTNGNYVVASATWDSPGPVSDVGAATWGDGTSGTSGAVSDTNSLVGATASDRVSGGTNGGGVTALTNGNYVVASSDWDAPGPVSDAGAATWGDGSTGVVDEVDNTNSLVGTSANDRVGSEGVTALANGNYVVASPSWDGPPSNAGAATWGDGTTGIVGAVSDGNSLVGATLDDEVSSDGVTALANGNYVVASAAWDGAVANEGAATWGDGSVGTTGPVSETNSLHGGANDFVAQGVTALTNGNYVVSSEDWSAPGPLTDVGAVTWGNGTTGTFGAVSAANSLVGSTVGDQVSSGGVTALANGTYVVESPLWDAPGPVANVGAITLGLTCNGGTIGPVNAINSVLGTASGGGISMVWAADMTINNQLVVGRPADLTVSLFRPDDSDCDAVPDTVEDGAPNAGDGNNDSTQDRLQGFVASLPNVVDGDYLTLVAPGTMQLMNVSAVANPAPLDPATMGVTFPVGFIEFMLITMPAPPSSVTLSLLLENPVTIDQYWRWGPESGMLANHFYRFDPVGGSPAVGATMVSPTQVDLTFVDGAKGDDDLIANGLLVDQGGPGGADDLPVQLLGFEARRAGRAVVLSWTTASEIKNAGFRVWREAPDGSITPISPLIPAQGGELGGASYRWVDWRAPRAAQRYWLEDISTSATRTRHGPVAVPAARGATIQLPPIGPPGVTGGEQGQVEDIPSSDQGVHQ